MSKQKYIRTYGPGLTLLQALGLLFIGLKLLAVTSVATWSWWLVLLPIYLPFAVLLAVLAGMLIFAAGFLLMGAMWYAVSEGRAAWHRRRHKP